MFGRKYAKNSSVRMFLVQRYTWNMTNSIEGKYLLPFSCILLRMHATLLNGVQLEQSKDLRQFKGGTGPWEATEQQLTSFFLFHLRFLLLLQAAGSQHGYCFQTWSR